MSLECACTELNTERERRLLALGVGDINEGPVEGRSNGVLFVVEAKRMRAGIEDRVVFCAVIIDKHGHLDSSLGHVVGVERAKVVSLLDALQLRQEVAPYIIEANECQNPAGHPTRAASAALDGGNPVPEATEMKSSVSPGHTPFHGREGGQYSVFGLPSAARTNSSNT